jgi:hypothetical protein
MSTHHNQDYFDRLLRRGRYSVRQPMMPDVEYPSDLNMPREVFRKYRAKKSVAEVARELGFREVSHEEGQQTIDNECIFIR